MRRVVLPLLIAVFFVQVAAGVSWTIDSTAVHPQRSANGSHGVVVAEVIDDDGDPVDPSHCSTINVTYDYDTDQRDVPLVYGGEPGWFYNDTLRFNGTRHDLTVVANGICDGQQTDSSVSQTQGFNASGDINVSFLTPRRPAEIGERDLRVAWNATNGSGAFEPGANLSYTLQNLSGTVVDSGSVLDGNVTANAANYTADIGLPFTAGWYVLAVDAENTSLSTAHPVGGTATMVEVLPRLSGSAVVRPTDGGCEYLNGMPDIVACEESADVEVAFNEQTGDATDVNATLTGDGTEFRHVDLTRANDTWLNASVRIPFGFDTPTYGWEMNVSVNATDGEVEAGDVTWMRVANFTIVESTQPFVRRGNAIDILAGPVTPFRENPVPPENVTEVTINIRNVTGHTVNQTFLTPPFDADSYDDQRELFSLEYLISLDAVTGEWSTTVQVENNHSVTKELTFTFDVLEEEDEGRPVVIAGAGGDTGVSELNKRFNSTGNRTVNVLINNTADVPALVDVFFSGNLTNVTTLQESEPVAFNADQLRTLHINLTLTEERSYIGNMTFFVHGSYVPEYNLTLPTNITVNPPFDCDFRNGSVCVTDTSLSRQVTASGDYNLSFTIDPVQDDIVDVSATDNMSDVLTSQSVNISRGELVTVDMPFTVEQGDQAFYEGEVELSGNNTSLSLPADLTVNTSIGRVSVTSGTDNLGTHIAGTSIPLDLTIENTGDVNVTSLAIGSPTLEIDEARSIDLEPDDSLTTTVDAIVPDADGEASATITVTTGSGGQASTTVAVTGFRNYSSLLDGLATDVEQLRTDLENVNAPGENKSRVREDLDRAETLITEGRTAWDNGDYSTASSRYSEAEQFVESADQTVTDLESSNGTDGDGGGGLPIVPIVVFIVLLGIIGAIVYLSVVPETEAADEAFEGYRQ